MEYTKRFLSFVLAAVMVLSMLPMPTLATEDTQPESAASAEAAEAPDGDEGAPNEGDVTPDGEETSAEGEEIPDSEETPGEDEENPDGEKTPAEGEENPDGEETPVEGESTPVEEEEEVSEEDDELSTVAEGETPALPAGVIITADAGLGEQLGIYDTGELYWYGYCTTTGLTKTVTVKNDTKNSLLTFQILDADLGSHLVSITGDGVTVENGTYTIQPESTAVLTVEFDNSSMPGIELKDIRLNAIADSINVTFSFESTLGTVQVGGEAVTDGESKTLTGDTVLTAAVTKEGATFLGWVDNTGALRSTDLSYTLTPTADLTEIKAAFASAETAAWFYAKGTEYLFDDLNAAAAFAATQSKDNTIVTLAASGTLAEDTDYEIPAAIDLLIPYKSDDKGVFNVAVEYGERTSSTGKPFVTLTVPGTSSITVYGDLNVNAKQAALSGGVAGYVNGDYGHLALESGAKLILESGASLTCYGYITGDGTVSAKGNSTVWELLQIADWRGGEFALQWVNQSKYRSSFLTSQYYVQNIEADFIMYPGAVENFSTCLQLSSMFFPAENQFIGPDGLVYLESGTLLRSYDSDTERMTYTVLDGGKATIQGIKVEAELGIMGVLAGVGSTLTLDSSDYVLAINSNLTFEAKGNSSIYLNEDFKLLPESEIYIENGSTLYVGGSLYLYGISSWDGKGYVEGNDLHTVHYSASRYFDYGKGKGSRDITAGSASARLQVDGDLIINGAVYSNVGDADNIISGTGTITNNCINGAGVEKEIFEINTAKDIESVTFVPVRGLLAGKSTSSTDPQAFTAGTYRNAGYAGNNHWYTNTITLTGETNQVKAHNGSIIIGNTGYSVAGGVFRFTLPYGYTATRNGEELSYALTIGRMEFYTPVSEDMTIEISGQEVEPNATIAVVAGGQIVQETKVYLPNGADISAYYTTQDCTTTYKDTFSGRETLYMPAVAAVASGDNTNYFATLTDAFYEIPSGAKVTVLDNITVDSPIVIPNGTEVTVDVNGKTITYASTIFNVYGKLHLDLAGGIIVNAVTATAPSEASAIVVWTNGYLDLDMNGGKLSWEVSDDFITTNSYSFNSGSVVAPVRTYNGSTTRIDMTDGIISIGHNASLSRYGLHAIYNQGDMEITGSGIITSDAYRSSSAGKFQDPDTDKLVTAATMVNYGGTMNIHDGVVMKATQSVQVFNATLVNGWSGQLVLDNVTFDEHIGVAVANTAGTIVDVNDITIIGAKDESGAVIGGYGFFNYSDTEGSFQGTGVIERIRGNTTIDVNRYAIRGEAGSVIKTIGGETGTVDFNATGDRYTLYLNGCTVDTIGGNGGVVNISSSNATGIYAENGAEINTIGGEGSTVNITDCAYGIHVVGSHTVVEEGEEKTVGSAIRHLGGENSTVNITNSTYGLYIGADAVVDSISGNVNVSVSRNAINNAGAITELTGDAVMISKGSTSYYTIANTGTINISGGYYQHPGGRDYLFSGEVTYADGYALSRNTVTAPGTETLCYYVGDDVCVTCADTDSDHLCDNCGALVSDHEYGTEDVTVADSIYARVCTVCGYQDLYSYRWESEDGSVGTLTTAGVADNALKWGSDTYYYKLTEPLELKGSSEWTVEWKMEFQDNAATGSRMLLSAANNNGDGKDLIFLLVHLNSKYIGFGYKDGNGKYQNYGTYMGAVSFYDEHVYRLENRIQDDGSNMIYLFVDGMEVGSLTHHYTAGTDNKTESNWPGEQESFTIRYFGARSFDLNGVDLDYISVLLEQPCDHDYKLTGETQGTCTEPGSKQYSCTLCGQSYTESTGGNAAGHDFGDDFVCDVCNHVATVSILGDSISTYTGVSNSTKYNTTIGKNSVYYSAGTYGIYRPDTWWQQTIDLLGMELCVNNSWSGSAIFGTRSGTVGAYVDRCVQLHNDNTGEEPDIILVFLGTNDFSYTYDGGELGDYDLGLDDEVNYDTLIQDNGDGSFTYAAPATSPEAYAIMLHKMQQRYPNAEIYCMSLMTRRDPVYSKADVGQPTAFNAKLKEVIDALGANYIELEGLFSSDPDEFDLYNGDKRVHPNEAGMDLMTQAVASALLEKAVYLVDSNLSGASIDNDSEFAVSGSEYIATVTKDSGYTGVDVTVTMNGEDITQTAYTAETGGICIPSVSGDIVITAEGVLNTDEVNFTWTFDSNKKDLVSSGEIANALTREDTEGSVSADGMFSKVIYSLAKPVQLYHDQEWYIEWRSINTSNSKGMLFASDIDGSRETGTSYLFKADKGLLGFGEITESTDNYGVHLTDSGVDITKSHVYRIENRVAPDGSNMAYLIIDDTNYGPMNNYYKAQTTQNKTVDWMNGKDLLFNYIGTNSHPLTGMSLDYLTVHYHDYSDWTHKEGDTYARTCSGCGDEITRQFTYLWTQDSTNGLVSSGAVENKLTKLGGTVANGILKDVRYSIASPVKLNKGENWAIEWRVAGDWNGMLFSDNETAGTTNMRLLFKTNNNTSDVLAFGYRDGVYKNSGYDLANSISGNWDVPHTYRIENQVDTNGDNNVYLYIDGEPAVLMNNYFEGSTPKGTTTDWLKDQSFAFGFIGAEKYAMNATNFEYLAVYVPEHVHSFGEWSYAEDDSYVRSCECGESETAEFTYLWQYGNNAFAPVKEGNNNLTLKSSVGPTDGSFQGVYYKMADQVLLNKDEAWAVEWKAAGDWNGMLFSNKEKGSDDQNTYLFKTYSYTSEVCPGLLAFGLHANSQYNNYGYNLPIDEWDMNAAHVYRIENRIAEDGTNTIWLVVDGKDISPMNHYYVGSKTDNGTNTWAYDQNFVFQFIGAIGFELKQMQLEYLAVDAPVHEHTWQDATCTEARTCSVCGTTDGDALDHDYVNHEAQAATCTEIGWDAYVTCTRCDYSTKGEDIPAINHGKAATAEWKHDDINHWKTCPDCNNEVNKDKHSYEDGKCVCGKSEVTLSTIMQIKSAALLFKDDIQIKFYFTVDGATDANLPNAGIEIWSDEDYDSENLGTPTQVISGLERNSSRYQIVTDGIAAKNMGDLLHVRGYIIVDGEKEYTKFVEYSPAVYCQNKIKDAEEAPNDAEAQDMAKLCISLMNYGAEAQKYFAATTEYTYTSLMNEFLTQEQKAWTYSESMIVPVSDLPKYSWTAADASKIKLNSASVVMTGALQIKLYATIPEGTIRMFYWTEATAGNELLLENATEMEDVGLNSSRYQGYVKGIAAKNMGQTIYLCASVTVGDTTYYAAPVAYSIHRYAANQISKADPISELAKTLIIYSNTAKTYLNTYNTQ